MPYLTCARLQHMQHLSKSYSADMQRHAQQKVKPSSKPCSSSTMCMPRTMRRSAERWDNMPEYPNLAHVPLDAVLQGALKHSIQGHGQVVANAFSPCSNMSLMQPRGYARMATFPMLAWSSPCTPSAKIKLQEPQVLKKSTMHNGLQHTKLQHLMLPMVCG